VCVCYVPFVSCFSTILSAFISLQVLLLNRWYWVQLWSCSNSWLWLLNPHLHIRWCARGYKLHTLQFDSGGFLL